MSSSAGPDDSRRTVQYPTGKHGGFVVESNLTEERIVADLSMATDRRRLCCCRSFQFLVAVESRCGSSDVVKCDFRKAKRKIGAAILAFEEYRNQDKYCQKSARSVLVVKIFS